MLRLTVAMCVAALIVLPFHVVSSDKTLDETERGAQLHDTACETAEVVQWGNGSRDTGFRFTFTSSVSSPAWARIWNDSYARLLPIDSAAASAPSRPLRLLQHALLL